MLYLIRHGQTDLTSRRLFCGQADPGLNLQGRASALRLRKYFEQKKIRLVYSSDLRRCSDYARLIFPEKKIIETKSLRELNFGSWEGLSFQEFLESGYKFTANPLDIQPPAGEKFLDFYLRVKNFWIELRKKKNVSVVTHAGVLRLFCLFYLQLDLKYFWSFDFVPGAILELG